jgi:hypothetical protein
LRRRRIGEGLGFDGFGLADPRVDLVRVARPVPHSDVHQQLGTTPAFVATNAMMPAALRSASDARDDFTTRIIAHVRSADRHRPPARSSRCGTPCRMLVQAQRLVDEPVGHRRP